MKNTHVLCFKCFICTLIPSLSLSNTPYSLYAILSMVILRKMSYSRAGVDGWVSTTSCAMVDASSTTNSMSCLACIRVSPALTFLQDPARLPIGVAEWSAWAGNVTVTVRRRRRFAFRVENKVSTTSAMHLHSNFILRNEAWYRRCQQRTCAETYLFGRVCMSKYEQRHWSIEQSEPSSWDILQRQDHS